METQKDLTSEQQTALSAYIEQFGKTWKTRLLADFPPTMTLAELKYLARSYKTLALDKLKKKGPRVTAGPVFQRINCACLRPGSIPSHIPDHRTITQSHPA
jgi:hypothetical protein